MHVVLIVIGLLLMIFGGGCAFAVGAITLTDPRAALDDLANILLFGGGMGVLPMVVGFLLFRRGLRIDKERRRGAMENFKASKPDRAE